MSVGEAVGGVAQGIGSVWGAYVQAGANEKMNADNLRLAYIQRGDLLDKQRRDEAFAGEQYRFGKKLAMSDRAYKSRMDREALLMQKLNNSRAFQQMLSQMYDRRAGRA